MHSDSVDYQRKPNIQQTIMVGDDDELVATIHNQLSHDRKYNKLKFGIYWVSLNIRPWLLYIILPLICIYCSGLSICKPTQVSRGIPLASHPDNFKYRHTCMYGIMEMFFYDAYSTIVYFIS